MNSKFKVGVYGRSPLPSLSTRRLEWCQYCTLAGVKAKYLTLNICSCASLFLLWMLHHYKLQTKFKCRFELFFFLFSPFTSNQVIVKSDGTQQTVKDSKDLITINYMNRGLCSIGLKKFFTVPSKSQKKLATGHAIPRTALEFLLFFSSKKNFQIMKKQIIWLMGRYWNLQTRLFIYI